MKALIFFSVLFVFLLFSFSVFALTADELRQAETTGVVTDSYYFEYDTNEKGEILPTDSWLCVYYYISDPFPYGPPACLKLAAFQTQTVRSWKNPLKSVSKTFYCYILVWEESGSFYGRWANLPGPIEGFRDFDLNGKIDRKDLEIYVQISKLQSIGITSARRYVSPSPVPKLAPPAVFSKKIASTWGSLKKEMGR